MPGANGDSRDIHARLSPFRPQSGFEQQGAKVLRPQRNVPDPARHSMATPFLECTPRRPAAIRCTSRGRLPIMGSPHRIAADWCENTGATFRVAATARIRRRYLSRSLTSGHSAASTKTPRRSLTNCWRATARCKLRGFSPTRANSLLRCRGRHPAVDCVVMPTMVGQSEASNRLNAGICE